MKILVLGGNGMIGHYFLKQWQNKYDVKVTLRKDKDAYFSQDLFHQNNSFFNCDVLNFSNVSKIVEDFRPDVLINAIGVTKQIATSEMVKDTIEINALLPHKLAALCKRLGVRMFQFSTDCVFSGKEGNYTESDASDAIDIYGKTKSLGDVIASHVVTIRKSTIGLELGGGHGLVEWFLSQTGCIKGYRKAIYSGIITSELVDVVEDIMLNHTSLSGIWNVASTPISKFDLLCSLKQKLNINEVQLDADDDFVCDRSLDGSRYNAETGYIAPSWDAMLNKLALEIKSR